MHLTIQRVENIDVKIREHDDGDNYFVVKELVITDNEGHTYSINLFADTLGKLILPIGEIE